MTVKIDQPIVGYKVKKDDDKTNLVEMHERLVRPEILSGSTYKLKTPLSEHALYITITDYVLNEGTDHESLQPFEIFINSKNMDNFQWIVALTRVISAVFRKGGECAFLVDELKAVFDPKGGYIKKGGKFMPSLVAEIGHVIEEHMISRKVIEAPKLDKHQQKLVDEKAGKSIDSEFPDSATLCGECSTMSVILMDGCQTCLNCAASKCG